MNEIPKHALTWVIDNEPLGRAKETICPENQEILNLHIMYLTHLGPSSMQLGTLGGVIETVTGQFYYIYHQSSEFKGSFSTLASAKEFSEKHIKTHLERNIIIHAKRAAQERADLAIIEPIHKQLVTPTEEPKIPYEINCYRILSDGIPSEVQHHICLTTNGLEFTLTNIYSLLNEDEPASTYATESVNYYKNSSSLEVELSYQVERLRKQFTKSTEDVLALAEAANYYK